MREIQIRGEFVLFLSVENTNNLIYANIIKDVKQQPRPATEDHWTTGSSRKTDDQWWVGYVCKSCPPPPQIPQHTHIHPSVLGNKPLIGCLLKRYVHLHVTITFFKFLLGCTDLNIINYSKMYRNTFQSYFPLLSSRENYFPIMTKLNQSTL